MFKALVAGVPAEGKGFIQEALNGAFGDVTINEVNVDIDRMDVREANNDSTVIFVSFDGVSEGRSSSFAEALINSDKYHSYKNLTELVEYLNSTYGSSITAPEEHDLSFTISDGEAIDSHQEDELERAKAALAARVGHTPRPEISVSGTQSPQGIAVDASVAVESSAEYEAKFERISGELKAALLEKRGLEDALASKELQLENLSQQLEEERELTGGEGNSDRISALEAEIKDLTLNLSISESKLEQANRQIKADASELEKLRADLAVALRERDSQTHSNTSSAIKISELQLENERLTLQLGELESLRTALTLEQSTSAGKDAALRGLTSEIQGLKDTIATKDAIISAKLNTGMSSTEEATLRAELARLQSVENRVEDFRKEMDEYAGKIEKENEDLRTKLTELETSDQAAKLVLEDNERLNKQLAIARDTISERDEQIISLRTSSETNRETAEESQSAIEYAAKFRDSMFGKLYDTALPKTTPPGIDLGSAAYPNIMFVFAGNGESFMDVYPRLRLIAGGFGQKNIKGIVVDMSAESNLDYEFRTKLESSTEWLERGGSIEGWITRANGMNSLWLMGFGTGIYMNESYLLTIDWNKRLTELNNSGYKIIMYMGSLGSLAGQVMYNSVAGRGRTRVYAKGVISSVRSLYNNMKQLGPKQKTVVQVYDFNKQSTTERFMKAVDGLGYKVTTERSRSGL